MCDDCGTTVTKSAPSWALKRTYREALVTLRDSILARGDLAAAHAERLAQGGDYAEAAKMSYHAGAFRSMLETFDGVTQHLDLEKEPVPADAAELETLRGHYLKLSGTVTQTGELLKITAAPIGRTMPPEQRIQIVMDRIAQRIRGLRFRHTQNAATLGLER